MHRTIFIIIVLCLLSTQASAFDLMRIIDAYESGAAMARQREIEEQQIQIQRLQIEEMKRRQHAQDEERRALQRLKKEHEAEKERTLVNHITDKIRLVENDRVRDEFKKRAIHIIDTGETTAERAPHFIALAKDIDTQLQRESALRKFEREVKPKILKVHPDFDTIVIIKNPDGSVALNDAYIKWAEQQRPALRTAALQSSEPDDIIWALSEYKKSNRLEQSKKARAKK